MVKTVRFYVCERRGTKFKRYIHAEVHEKARACIENKEHSVLDMIKDIHGK